MIKNYIGIEGGASQTKFSLLQVQQDKIEVVQILVEDKTSNPYLIGMENINQICTNSKIDLSQINQITMSVSGFNNTPDELLKQFKQNGINCKIYALHDSLACISLLTSEAKTTIIAGTGNAATLLYNNKQQIFGAYGHELSENGSGYSTVRNYINRCINGLDMLEFQYSLEEYQRFYQQFAQFQNISSDCRSDSLLQMFYPTQKKKIASFCKRISELAIQQEDKQLKQFCQEILMQQIQYLAELCYSMNLVLKKQNYDKQIQCFMIGSLWKILEITEIKEYFIDCLDQMQLLEKFQFFQGNDFSGCIGTALYDRLDQQIFRYVISIVMIFSLQKIEDIIANKFLKLEESLCGNEECLAVCRNYNKQTILLGSQDGILKRVVNSQLEQMTSYGAEIYAIDSCDKYIIVGTSKGIYITQNKKILYGTETTKLPIDISEQITSIHILKYENLLLQFVFGTNQGQIGFISYQTQSNEIQQTTITNINQCIHQLYIANYNDIKYIACLTYQNQFFIIKYSTEPEIVLQFKLQDNRHVEGVYDNIQTNFVVIQDSILIVSNDKLYIIDISGKKEEKQLNLQQDFCQICHLSIEKQHILALISQDSIFIGIYQQNSDCIFKQLTNIKIDSEENKQIVDFNYYQINGEKIQYLWYKVVINNNYLVKNIEKVDIDIQKLLDQIQAQPIPIKQQPQKIQEQPEQKTHMIQKIEESDSSIQQYEQQQEKQDNDKIINEQSVQSIDNQNELQKVLPHQYIINKSDYQRLLDGEYQQQAKFQLSTSCILPMIDTDDINEQYNYDNQQDLINTLQYYNKIQLLQNAYGQVQLQKNILTLHFNNPDIPIQQIKSTTGQIIACDIKQDCFCYLTPNELRAIQWNQEQLLQTQKIKINIFSKPIQCVIGNDIYQTLLYDNGNIESYENGVKIFSIYLPSTQQIQMLNNILLVVGQNTIKLFDVYSQHKLFEADSPCDNCTFSQLDNNYNIFVADSEKLYMSCYMSGIETVQMSWTMILSQEESELRRIYDAQQEILNIKKKIQQGDQNVKLVNKDVDQLIPVYKLIQYVAIDKFKVIIYYIPIQQDENEVSGCLKLKYDQKYNESLEQLFQKDISQFQENGFKQIRATPSSILSLKSVQNYELKDDYQLAVQILSNARCLKQQDINQLLPDFDKLSIIYSLELYKQNNIQGAKYPLSKLQLRTSLESARATMQQVGSQELQDYCTNLYYDTYDEEEIDQYFDTNVINIGSGRMILSDIENVRPLFNERIDDFTINFNSGGKLELRRWQKDIKVELQKQIQNQYQDILKSKHEVRKQTQNTHITPRDDEQQDIQQQPEKILPLPKKDGNKRFLEQLGNKRQSPQQIFEAKKPEASPIRAISQNSLFGVQQ